MATCRKTVQCDHLQWTVSVLITFRGGSASDFLLQRVVGFCRPAQDLCVECHPLLVCVCCHKRGSCVWSSPRVTAASCNHSEIFYEPPTGSEIKTSKDDTQWQHTLSLTTRLLATEGRYPSDEQHTTRSRVYTSWHNATTSLNQCVQTPSTWL